MLGVRLTEDLDLRLSKLAKVTHRSKSHYMKNALKAYLDEYEQVLTDVAEYEEQRRNGTLVTYSLEEVMKELNLEKDDLDN